MPAESELDEEFPEDDPGSRTTRPRDGSVAWFALCVELCDGVEDVREMSSWEKPNCKESMMGGKSFRRLVILKLYDGNLLEERECVDDRGQYTLAPPLFIVKMLPLTHCKR